MYHFFTFNMSLFLGSIQKPLNYEHMDMNVRKKNMSTNEIGRLGR